MAEISTMKAQARQEFQEWITGTEYPTEEAQNIVHRGRGWDAWDGSEAWDTICEYFAGQTEDEDEAYDKAYEIFAEWQTEFANEYLGR